MKIDRTEIKAAMLKKMDELGLDVAKLGRQAGVGYNVPRDFLVRDRSSMPTFDKMIAMLDTLNLTERVVGIGRDDLRHVVPVIGEVPGGSCRDAQSEHTGDFVYFRSGKKNLFGLYVRGTSINRVAADGAVVIVDGDVTAREALANQLVVVMINRHGVWETTCKVYKTNPDRFEPHSTETHDTIYPGGDEWVICGRVVGSVAYVHNFGELLDVRRKDEYIKLMEAS